MSHTYRVLIAGDFHIPFRAPHLPPELLTFLDTEKFDLVAITGDLVQMYVLEPFRKFPLKAVRGNMDIGEAEKLPEVEEIRPPNSKYKVILFHGTGIYPRGEPMLLRGVALKHGAKVILTGHTHEPDVRKIIDTIIINPGSATGVYGGSGGLGIPTWAVAEFSSNNIEIKIYGVRSQRVAVILRKSFEILEEE